MKHDDSLGDAVLVEGVSCCGHLPHLDWKNDKLLYVKV